MIVLETGSLVCGIMYLLAGELIIIRRRFIHKNVMELKFNSKLCSTH